MYESIKFYLRYIVASDQASHGTLHLCLASLVIMAIVSHRVSLFNVSTLYGDSAVVRYYAELTINNCGSFHIIFITTTRNCLV